MFVVAQIFRAVTQGGMSGMMPCLARKKCRVVNGRVACRRAARRSPKALGGYVIAMVTFVLTVLIQVMLRFI
jgi:hypothetical protein